MAGPQSLEMQMTKFKTALLGAVVFVGLPTLATAQSDYHAAPGVQYLNAYRILPNGEVEPPPALRANGGVGEDEDPVGNAQTLSGGPVGGNSYQNR
jgi:hypothetical protein